jgi:hypothetical protein
MPPARKEKEKQNNMKKTLFSVLAPVGLLTLTGCQVLSYSGPSGEHFTRTSFAANTTISSLRVEADTNGLRRVELKGYQNDSTQALSTVTDAAVKAAIQSVK